MHIKTSEQPSLKLGFGDYLINWGTHACCLFETDTEKDDLIYQFLKAGIPENCLEAYVMAEGKQTDFKKEYIHRCPTCSEYINNPDNLQILKAKDLYYPKGTFSPWDMDDGLNAFYQKTQSKGHRHIRSLAEMKWALEKIPGIENLMAYEARLNFMVMEKPWVTICLYDVTKFSGQIIMNVLRTHPFIIRIQLNGCPKMLHNFYQKIGRCHEHDIK